MPATGIVGLVSLIAGLVASCSSFSSIGCKQEHLEHFTELNAAARASTAEESEQEHLEVFTEQDTAARASTAAEESEQEHLELFTEKDPAASASTKESDLEQFDAAARERELPPFCRTNTATSDGDWMNRFSLLLAVIAIFIMLIAVVQLLPGGIAEPVATQDNQWITHAALISGRSDEPPQTVHVCRVGDTVWWLKHSDMIQQQEECTIYNHSEMAGHHLSESLRRSDKSFTIPLQETDQDSHSEVVL